jgi:AcrR family transcriptional regulator
MGVRNDQTKSRRGRPPAGQRAERERDILQAALDELTDQGYEGVTMLDVANRAGASKETLYRWFGNKDGLFAELIKSNADRSAEQIRAALDGDADPRESLVGYAMGLLGLLTSEGSLALNRAAMTSSTLAAVLLAHGRHRIGPLVEDYLGRLGEAGELAIDDPAEAFQLLYGLVMRDTQIRVLLGEPAPSPAELRSRATDAVDEFFVLRRPDSR